MLGTACLLPFRDRGRVLKVLFVTRPDALTAPGGDTVQVYETAAALRALRVDVRVADCAEPNMTGVDVVHAFNLTRPHDLLPAVLRARQAGRAVALSTIFVPKHE